MNRVVLRHLIVATIVVAVAIVTVSLAGWSPQVEYIAALGLLLAIATAALRRVGTAVAESQWPPPLPPRVEPGGVDPQVSALEMLLRRSVDDPGIFRRRLRTMLADLTTHRLRRDHGIDPAEHPDEARQLLGEAAWHVLTTDESVTAARLEEAISAIEQLPRLARPT